MTKRKHKRRFGQPVEETPPLVRKKREVNVIMDPLVRKRANYEKDDSTPGWKEQFIRDVTPFLSKSKTKRRTIFFGKDVFEVADLTKLVVQAAKSRNLPVTGYIRRAVVAFIVYDLGVSWGDCMDGVMVPLEHDEWESGSFSRDRPQDTGRDRGPWRIEALSEVPEEATDE